MNAKNHAVVMPDAHKEATLSSLLTGAFGTAGQTCMSLGVAVMVGEARDWLPDLVRGAGRLAVSAGSEAEADLGPVISAEARENIRRLVQAAVEDGADLVLDGRGVVVEKYTEGHFVGPTIISNVTTDMRVYREVILYNFFR